MRTSFFAAALMCLSLMGACTVADESTNTGADAAGPAAIDCGVETCDPTKQYCIVSEGNDRVMAEHCAPLAACAFSDCDCLNAKVEADWKATTQGTDNCTAAVYDCRTSSKAGATVTCRK